MNILKGKIKSILTEGNLSLVQVTIGDLTIKSIVIETPDSVSWLNPGHPVDVLFKESEVIIAKESAKEISLRTRFPGVIDEITKGILLSRITLVSQGKKITSIITSNAVEQLGLKPGDHIIAMVKTNEVMLSV